MIGRLRAGWATFGRIHLAALIADWRRTLLSIVGVAIGVTVVLGVLILKFEVARPFDSFGPALTHAAGAGVIEVRPEVSGRLPVATVDRLRAEVPGAQAVIPVVAALTPVEVADGADRGFFLLGGSCQIELLIGPFDCAQRAGASQADGPGIPLQMPTAIADRHGLHPGDELRMPGLPPHAVHLGATFPELDRVEDINNGYVLLAPTAESAAALLSRPGFVTSAFVIPQPGAAVTADVQRVIAGAATARPPRPQLPAVFENGKQTSDLTAIAGIIVGVLIAMNTILLAVEDRRAVMGTIGAIGAQPLGLFAGFIGTGALVGLLGGLLSVPGGFLLGTYMVDRLGRSALAGSGGTVAAHFTPNLIGIAAAAGVLCGVLATVGPAARLVRDGPLASMASAGGVQRTRTIPTWPLVVGVALLAGSVVMFRVFERGRLPLGVGINGLAVALFGIVLVTVWVAPRIAEVLIGALTLARPAVGRLLGADFRRYTLLFALSAALLAESASLVIGAHSMQILGAGQIAEQKADVLPAALLIAPQSVLDQRDGHISDSVFEKVSDTAAGQPVESRWRSTISSGAASRLVVGVTPGESYGEALYQPTDDGNGFWNRLRDGEVGLSEIAASRLGVGAGDTVELPAVAGRKQYRVAGVFRPRIVSDTAVGDIVLVSVERARTDWAAVRDQVAVLYPSAAQATAHRADFLDLGAGLHVFDDAQWRAVADGGITRFLQPFTLAGYIVMAAAGVSVLNVFVLGLVQRRRERAVLRAIGMTSGQEQAVIIANAVLLAVLAAGMALLGGVGLTYLWSLGSPVFYGIKISWGLPLLPLRTVVVAVFALVAAAAAYPLIHARRLETVDVLRAN